MLCKPSGWPVAAPQVQAQLDESAKAHTDGVNFDLEDPAGPGSALAHAYTALVAETAAAFHARDPGSQVCPGPSAGSSVLHPEGWPTLASLREWCATFQAALQAHALLRYKACMACKECCGPYEQ